VRVTLFANRFEAGRRLARRLESLPREHLVVLGLPRGGVPVASEVARELQVPLDVIVVRKLGAPFQPELAMGAIGEDGVRIVNERVVRALNIPTADLDAVEARERVELERRSQLFRGARSRIPLHGSTALIVDDGIATGFTMRAACRVARAHGARRVIVATPVAPPSVVVGLRDDADEVIALYTPEPFAAVGAFYADFDQTSDAEVVRLLAAAPNARAASRRARAGGSDDPASRSEGAGAHRPAPRAGDDRRHDHGDEPR
jgi:putative phosphoribosyl transferase